MQFTKVKDVKSPCRGTPESAGIDFFVPNKLDVRLFDNLPHHNIGFDLSFCITGDYTYVNKFTLRPGGRILIPSGIHVRLDQGTALVLTNKSGVAAKTGIIIGSCLVDQDYMGEIHLSLINTSNNEVTIEAGQKIVQGVIYNVNLSTPEEIDNIENLYLNFESERQAGGFGSTGTK